MYFGKIDVHFFTNHLRTHFEGTFDRPVDSRAKKPDCGWSTSRRPSAVWLFKGHAVRFVLVVADDEYNRDSMSVVNAAGSTLGTVTMTHGALKHECNTEAVSIAAQIN